MPRTKTPKAEEKKPKKKPAKKEPEKRIGRQTPTVSYILPCTGSKGQESIDLYEKSKRSAAEWQKLICFHILETNENGGWVHTKYGFSVPRQNGKNEIVAMREMWGLVNGERILHTAHRVPTSNAAFERLRIILSNAGYKELGRKKKGRKDPPNGFRVSNQMGMERIELVSGGRINFRTRSARGGIGESYDLLVIDEAQEYTEAEDAALKYVIAASQNPQQILCGTPPTPDSVGTVFTDLRSEILSGEAVDSGWEEWSVGQKRELRDKDAWYESNPSLGILLTERRILSELSSNVDDYNIQRLGYWTSYNLKSEISEAEWTEMKTDVLPELKGRLFVGIKYAKDGANVAMSIAVKCADGNIFVEAIDCQSRQTGDDWIMRFLRAADIEKVIIDGAGAQDILSKEIKEAGLKAPVLPQVKEVVVAAATFRQAVDLKKIRHAGQPSLTQSVTNCEKRAVGSGGGFGFRSIREGVDVSLLDSVMLAYWACSIKKERRKQKAYY